MEFQTTFFILKSIRSKTLQGIAQEGKWSANIFHTALDCLRNITKAFPMASFLSKVADHRRFLDNIRGIAKWPEEISSIKILLHIGSGYEWKSVS